jgi:hypothetical protein
VPSFKFRASALCLRRAGYQVQRQWHVAGYGAAGLAVGDAAPRGYDSEFDPTDSDLHETGSVSSLSPPVRRLRHGRHCCTHAPLSSGGRPGDVRIVPTRGTSPISRLGVDRIRGAPAPGGDSVRPSAHVVPLTPRACVRGASAVRAGARECIVPVVVIRTSPRERSWRSMGRASQTNTPRGSQSPIWPSPC